MQDNVGSVFSALEAAKRAGKDVSSAYLVDHSSLTL